MRLRISLRAACILPMLAALPACNKPQNMASEPVSAALDMVAPAAIAVAEEPAPAAPSGRAEIPVHLPQIAYSYRYGFAVPAGLLEVTQKAHVAACDRLGPARCQIVTMSRSGGAEFESGSLRLKVDAAKARRFGADLEKSVSSSGGELNDSSTSAEDLSKQIIDTDARVKAKTLLAQRLTELLKTRNGTTADLVAAERALADVQEELDGAGTYLAEMKGRVAMSDIDINYSTQQTATKSFFEPMKTAFSSVGETFAISVAALVRFLIFVLPWGLALFGFIKLYRILGGRVPRLRWPGRKQASEEPDQSST